MRSSLIISRRFNAKHIAMDDDSRGETIGVLLRDGRCRYVKWLGFIDRTEAMGMARARPVKLEIARVGVKQGLGNQWTDLEDGEYVVGCMTEEGAYAVADVTVRTIKAEKDTLG